MNEGFQIMKSELQHFWYRGISVLLPWLYLSPQMLLVIMDLYFFMSVLYRYLCN